MAATAISCDDNGDGASQSRSRQRWRWLESFLLFLVGTAVFYVINSVFLVLQSFLDLPVPEGKHIAADMSFTAQAGTVLVFFYILLPSRLRPQIPSKPIMPAILLCAFASALGLAFFWKEQVGGKSITLWCVAGIAGSAGSFGNLVGWMWCSEKGSALLPSLSAGMAAGALVPSIISIIMQPGKHERFSVAVFYFIAAAIIAASILSYIWLEVDEYKGRQGGNALFPSSIRNKTKSNISPSSAEHTENGLLSHSRGTSINTPQSAPKSEVHFYTDTFSSTEKHENSTLPDMHPASERAPLLPVSGSGPSSYVVTSVAATAATVVGSSGNSGSTSFLGKHRFFISCITLTLCATLIFGWQPGLFPYLVPEGHALTAYQVCGQVADVLGRVAASAHSLKGKQFVFAAVETALFFIMVVLAFTVEQQQSWFAPTMCILNSGFAFAYGTSSTLFMMSTEVPRLVQLLGAFLGIGSGIGGISVYFFVQNVLAK